VKTCTSQAIGDGNAVC